MKILVVDDQKDNRQLLEAFLTEYGHQVVQASNGKEALDQLRNQHFDLVVSDILMPGMDGFQLCRYVKRDELLKNIPFVFYTASYVEKEDEELALRFGADEFLRQPVDPEELEAIINRLTKKEEPISEEPPAGRTENGQDVFKLYNERLLHKLEKKVADLEKEITERKRAEEELEKFRDQLSELVDENTTELKQINLQLEQEIADRSEMESALRQNEERSRAQYKGFPIPTYTWQKVGSDFVLINCNDAADAITHGKMSEFIGKTAAEMYKDRPLILQDLDHCFNSKTVFQREMAYRYMSTGKLKHLIVTYAYISPDLLIIHTEDITQRKQAEEALQKSHHELEARVEERTRALTEANRRLQEEIAERNQARAALLKETEKAQQYLDIANVMIVVLNPDQTVRLINRRGCEILGYSSEEIIGKKWFETFIPPPIGNSITEMFDRVIDGEIEPMEYYENPIMTKDGRERLIEWHNASIKDETGKILGTISSGTDITDRKKAEEMMIQAEKMATVGNLAAGMAHEINNPLAGIIQSIHVSQNRLSTESPDNRKIAGECGTTIETINAYLDRRKINKFLEGAREAGERAAAIVENMLSFSRKSESSFTFNDIRELLDKTITLAENEYDLRKKYDFRQIAIVREYDPDLPRIPCEAIKIRQVILNLLKNAAQAIHQADTASKSKEPRITIRTSRKENMACIEIEDNGPGMPNDVRKRIFEPFFTTKSVGDGTGLGLSISYYIITQDHRGTMEVHSTPGHGTTFSIRLPIGKREGRE
jgi:PAS domain S-box-containing protein